MWKLFSKRNGRSRVTEADPAGSYARFLRAERKFVESWTDVLDNYVDPEDAFLGDNGETWLKIGADASTTRAVSIHSEAGLAEVRQRCRQLAETNEFAINGHENRISYIVGTGHKYQVAGKVGGTVPKEKLALVQEILDQFCKATRWQQRQQEIVRRKDRDGECFIRLFDSDAGLQLRFIEPGQVATPQEMQSADRPEASMGILTAPDDVETVLGYYVDGELVEAEEVQHRKGNVDSNVKRGLPLFYPVRKILQRVETLHRNMAVVAGIQSAIAMIRKHGIGGGATSANISSMISGDADRTVTKQSTGKTSYFRHYAPGTILDSMSQTEYEFPSHSVKPDAFVPLVQCQLRAVASRLVMPEFMLTSDASNANYSSTMVAEGPAVKMFERLQYDMIVDDLAIMDRVLDLAVNAGRLPGDLRDAIEISVTAPQLTTRDRLQDTQADRILVELDAMSRDTLQLKHDLDPEHETELIDARREKMDPFAGMGHFGRPPDKEDEGEEDANVR